MTVATDAAMGSTWRFIQSLCTEQLGITTGPTKKLNGAVLRINNSLIIIDKDMPLSNLIEKGRDKRELRFIVSIQVSGHTDLAP